MKFPPPPGFFEQNSTGFSHFPSTQPFLAWNRAKNFAVKVFNSVESFEKVFPNLQTSDRQTQPVLTMFRPLNSLGLMNHKGQTGFAKVAIIP